MSDPLPLLPTDASSPGSGYTLVADVLPTAAPASIPPAPPLPLADHLLAALATRRLVLAVPWVVQFLRAALPTRTALAAAWSVFECGGASFRCEGRWEGGGARRAGERRRREPLVRGCEEPTDRGLEVRRERTEGKYGTTHTIGTSQTLACA